MALHLQLEKAQKLLLNPGKPPLDRTYFNLKLYMWV
jgi:hypothetical protein